MSQSQLFGIKSTFQKEMGMDPSEVGKCAASRRDASDKELTAKYFLRSAINHLFHSSKQSSYQMSCHSISASKSIGAQLSAGSLSRRHSRCS